MKIRVLVLTVLLLRFTALGEDLTKEEIDYRADFIVKIADYVTWPDDTKASVENVLVIAVVGESPLTPRLKELAGERSGEGQNMTVKMVLPEDDLTDCHILFLPTEDKAELAQILKKVQNAPVLTISDCHYFARYGVMVNFYKEEDGDKGKTKFEVNTMTLSFVGLKMSSKLLKLASVI